MPRLEHPIPGKTSLLYLPTKKQFEFHAGRGLYFERAALCGGGAGKTICGLFEDIRWAIDYPGSVGVITEPSYPMVRLNLIPALESKYLLGCPFPFRNHPYIANFSRLEMRLDWRNGSQARAMPEDKKMITVDESEYKGLLAKTVSQGTQIDQLKAQLHDATEAVNVLQAKIDSAESQEKEALIDTLFRDSQGKLSKEMLQKDSLKELYIRKETIDKAEPKTFVSVMRQREEDAKKPISPGTVGTFNQATGKYEGGLDI